MRPLFCFISSAEFYYGILAKVLLQVSLRATAQLVLYARNEFCGAEFPKGSRTFSILWLHAESNLIFDFLSH